MNIMEWLFALLLVLFAIWLGIATYILAQEWQVRREWRLQDERVEWRRKVDAMRRIHDEQLDAYRDDRGDA